MHARHLLSAIVSLSATMMLGACASEPKAAEAAAPPPSPVKIATWTPDAGARVVTVERQSSFAVVERDRDLFVLRTEGYIDGLHVAQITWILSTPSAELGPARYPLAKVSAELERSGATEMAGDRWEAPPSEPAPGDAVGWVIIDRAGWERTVRHVSGEIEIVGLDTDRASISVRLDAQGVEDTLVYEGECPRVERPRAIGVDPVPTRSGLPHRPQDEEEPNKTDPVWPWNEIFRETAPGEIE